MGGDLWAILEPKQTLVNHRLSEWADGLAQIACPPILAEAVKYALMGPGKRLRPLLCLLACEAVGGTTEQALPAACAVEMVHTYSLVHDDLPAMDDDDLRRGRPTCHVKYGEALGILVGDALLTAAFEVLAHGYGPKTVAVASVELARGAGPAGMVGGQVLDLIADGRIAAGTGDGASGSRQVELEQIHRLKTGALFRSSLRLGVYAAQAERPEGINGDQLAAIDEYAAAFGLAFQVTDDLLDVESSAEATGKRVGKDAARGKLTYPQVLGVEGSREKAASLGRQAMAAADRLGSAPLAALAEFVVTRDR
ncbi:MAG: polyprenyl synthetase family protein [Fimbriiglobus sp.]|nr:polyprenyl synthetase family protein [Fimbriiglobus sp.]